MKKRDMNPNAKRAIVLKLMALAREVFDQPSQDDHSHYSSQHTNFNMSTEQATVHQELANQIIHENKWEYEISNKAVENAILDVLDNLFNEESITEEATIQYLDDLLAKVAESLQEWIVYIPLVGIEMKMESLKLGNITFVNMASAKFDELAARVRFISEGKNPSDESRFVADIMVNKLGTTLSSVCVLVQVCAEADKARDRAEAECRQILDLLAYASPSLYSKGFRVAVGIRGEAHPEWGYLTLLLFSTDGNKLSFSHRSIGAYQPFILDSDTVKHMEELGVFALAEIVAKPPHIQRTDFEAALLDSVHWFANSQTETEGAHELLNLITCLEILFTSAGNPIGMAIAEGVAFILSDTKDERKAILDTIKPLYNKRSAVTHSGSKEITEKDLQYLRHIVRHVIRELIQRRNEFSTRKSLADWVLDEKMS